MDGDNLYDQSEKELDDVFRHHLASIRPHIHCIRSVSDADLCLRWIEKLNNASREERPLRNMYMCELRHQVRVGELMKPFDMMPQGGPLPAFPSSSWDSERPLSSSCSDMSASTVSWRTEVYETSCSERCGGTTIGPLQEESERESSKEDLSSREAPVESSQTEEESVQLYESSEEQSPKVSPLEPAQSVEVLVTTPQFQSDISDIHCFEDDIEKLRKKFDEAKQSKLAFDSHEKQILRDYHSQIGEAMINLCHRIASVQAKSNDVEHKVQVAMEQLEKLCLSQQAQSQNMSLLKCASCQHALPAYSLPQSDEGSPEINGHVNNLKKLVELKDKEIQHLETILKTQCLKMQEEVKNLKKGIKHVSVETEKKLKYRVMKLQKILAVHARIKAKLVRDYDHQILCLQKEKKLEVKALELQIQSQRVEIFASLCQDKQRELKAAVGDLEQRYKELFFDLEEQYRKRQEEDKMHIIRLEKELSFLSSHNKGQSTENSP